MLEIKDQIIPSCVNNGQLKYAAEETDYEYIMLKMGDIFTVRKMANYLHSRGKKMMVHLDSLKGVTRDSTGFEFLKKSGVDSVITMKSRQIRMIKDSGITAVLGCFIVDSASLEQTIINTHSNKPDAIIVMPMTVPDTVYEKIREACDVTILAGGLGVNREIIRHVLDQGVSACAVTDAEMFL